MKREVQLTLAGRSLDASGQETVTKQTVIARYAFRDGHHFFLYDEQPEGTSSKTRCLIRLRNGYMELSKKGGVNTRMVFEDGREHRTEYATPYGNLWLGIRTYKAALTDSQDETDPAFLQYAIQYDLTSEGLTIGEYTMTVQAVSVTDFPKICNPI